MVVVVQVVELYVRILSQELFEGFYLRNCYPKNYRKQSLLWVTCTGHHWSIALWISIGST